MTTLKPGYDFGGIATKANTKCTDGRTILKDAFKHVDGITVPLVWQHLHNEPANVLGHALLEYLDDGSVYAHGKLNATPTAGTAKILIEHGDVNSLSIYANGIVEKSKAVLHGNIREVSLVLSGANPGAKIDNISIQHEDGTIDTMDDEVVISSGVDLDLSKKVVEHADEETEEDETEEDETIGQVLNTLSSKQKTALYSLLGDLMTRSDTTETEENTNEEADESIAQSAISDQGDDKTMKHNVFDGNDGEKESKRVYLTADQFNTIMNDAQKLGSLKASVMQHAGTYGIDNIDYLFPDAQALLSEPTFIARDMAWVSKVLSGTRHSPFSRIKMLHADITVETARAKGYVTGAEKDNEVFGLLKRVTTPTTIYKKQKLDRNDIIDVTTMNVVAWLKAEMRVMLNEEIARAILISDGRLVADPDKIDEAAIRPIWTDADLYAHHVKWLATLTDPEDIIDAIITARVNYKGSGSPDLFMTTELLTEMLLIKDTTGRRIYKTKAELEGTLNVNSIVEVPLMSALERNDGTNDVDLLAIMVNLRDYVVGADKGGEINFFDDFDLNFNQYLYLLETRISGSLVLPKSALVFERIQAV